MLFPWLFFVTFLFIFDISSSEGKHGYLFPLPAAEFEANSTKFTKTTGGLYDSIIHGVASNYISCSNNHSFNHHSAVLAQYLKNLDCHEHQHSCLLQRFNWCQSYYTQKRVPWKPIPRGNTSCPNDHKGRECGGVGVCDYDFGLCLCPAGWKGRGCEIRIAQRCHNGPGSREGLSRLGLSGLPPKAISPPPNSPNTFNTDLILNSSSLSNVVISPNVARSKNQGNPNSLSLEQAMDPAQWIHFIVNVSSDFLRCGGHCDDVSGICYCGLGPYQYRPPPLGSPPDAMGTGRMLGSNCVPNTTATGEPLNWGYMTWEAIYGAKGYCMVPQDSNALDEYGNPLYDRCHCQTPTSVSEFCAVPYDAFCLNSCNGRGRCDRGFCKCLPGWYGSDCARRRAGLPTQYKECTDVPKIQ